MVAQDTEAKMIKVQKVSGGTIGFYLVTEDGINIGFLRKGTNNRTTICPWQPMTMNNEMIADPASPSGYAACYGSTGKADAIAILKEAVGDLTFEWGDMPGVQPIVVDDSGEPV